MTKLSVINGGKRDRVVHGNVTIAVAPRDTPPFAVDVEILEEDTFLVLSAPAEIREVREHPIRLMTSLHEAKPRTPGSAVVKGSRIFAIVHDLHETPTTTGPWIESAARAAFDHARRLKARSVGLQMLGSVHAPQNHSLSALHLANVLKTEAQHPMTQIWVMAPLEVGTMLFDRL